MPYASKVKNLRETILFIIISIILLPIPFTASASDEKSLTVKISAPVYYESQDGKKFTARYGSLSDGSLHFVKIRMPDGQKYTLPQSVSGSGARYTDDMEIVWWEHHGKVQVDVRGPDGKWLTKYSGLKEVREKINTGNEQHK